MATLLVNTGRAIVTSRLNGGGTTPSYVAWGTGAVRLVQLIRLCLLKMVPV